MPCSFYKTVNFICKILTPITKVETVQNLEKKLDVIKKSEKRTKKERKIGHKIRFASTDVHWFSAEKDQDD